MSATSPSPAPLPPPLLPGYQPAVPLRYPKTFLHIAVIAAALLLILASCGSPSAVTPTMMHEAPTSTSIVDVRVASPVALDASAISTARLISTATISPIVATTPISAISTPGPFSGRYLVLSSPNDGPDNLYVVSPDGHTVTQLTHDRLVDEYNGWPAWSSDGLWIAFISGTYEQGRITVIRPDGTHRSQLSPDAAIDGPPAWSPDGQWIAFMSHRNREYGLYLIRPDGSQLTRLTTTAWDMARPIWSPDGQRIAFLIDGTVAIIQIDGSHQTRIPLQRAVTSLPTWAPDSQHLALEADGTFYLATADGHDIKRLPTKANVFYRMLTWSPDGEHIAFRSPKHIYVMNSDGREVLSVGETDGPANDLSWSPDGQYIGFTNGVSVDIIHVGTHQRLYLGIDLRRPIRSFAWGPQ